MDATPPPAAPPADSKPTPAAPKRPWTTERANTAIFQQMSHAQERLLNLAIRASRAACDTNLPLASPDHPAKPIVRDFLRTLNLLHEAMAHELSEQWLINKLDSPPCNPNGKPQ